MDERNAVYRPRRDVLVAGLRQLGLAVRTAESLAVCLDARSGRAGCSQHFAAPALEQAGVSLTPGTVFGPGGQGYVRISITAPLERLKQADDSRWKRLAEQEIMTDATAYFSLPVNRTARR